MYSEQINPERAKSELSRVLLELIKEELPKQVWGRISKERFSSVDLRRGRRLPEGI